MPLHGLKKSDAWGRAGPGGTQAWTMSWEVDGITTKPDFGPTTSVGEKEKKLLQSDNKQPNLKTWEIPLENQQILAIDMRLTAGKAQFNTSSKEKHFALKSDPPLRR